MTQEHLSSREKASTRPFCERLYQFGLEKDREEEHGDDTPTRTSEKTARGARVYRGVAQRLVRNRDECISSSRDVQRINGEDVKVLARLLPTSVAGDVVDPRKLRETRRPRIGAPLSHGRPDWPHLSSDSNDRVLWMLKEARGPQNWSAWRFVDVVE